jgi:para-nitrobenzyl esterase
VKEQLTHEVGAEKVCVVTASGLVRGTRDGDVISWRGVPYAEPPVGPLRFRAPVSRKPWTGVLDARDHDADDCLTVDVVAPADQDADQRPVVVSLDGTGTGTDLARSGGVVHVSVSSRSGPLGFLDLTRFSTPDRPFQSNVGVRDQVAALRWVQRNIATFGGDPDNVTVFGVSTGADAVTALLAAPSARGLFTGAVVQSASVTPTPDSEAAAEHAREFLRALDVSPRDAAEVLPEVSAERLAEVSAAVGPFTPVVDGDVLPRHPVDACRDGTANPVPLIIGSDAAGHRQSAALARAHSRHAATYSYHYDVRSPPLRVVGVRQDLSDRMRAHWLSFTHRRAPLETWPVYSESSRRVLVLDQTDRVELDVR